MFELKEKTPVTKETKPAARRIYLVRDAQGEDHLVEATSSAQAIGHIYEPECRVATGIEIANMIQAGARVVQAGLPKQEAA